MTETNFFNEAMENEDNSDLLDVIGESELNFLLWNRTQNIAYEAASTKNGFFMDGFESDEGDKIYILDVKQNLLIDFKG